MIRSSSSRAPSRRPATASTYDRALFNVGDPNGGSVTFETDGETTTISYLSDDEPGEDDPLYQQEKTEAIEECRLCCQTSKGAEPCGFSACRDSGLTVCSHKRKHLWQHCTEANATGL